MSSMEWTVNFYHTESQFRTGNPTMSFKRTGSREAVINEAKNLAKARGDYTYEVIRSN